MTVTIDGTVSRSLPGSGGVTTVEARIDPVAKTKPTTRHVVVLVDTSGSMAGQKIENAKRGATEALEKLADEDFISIVGFDQALDVVLPVTRWGGIDQDEAKTDVSDIESGGGTDIYKGLERARDHLLEEMPDETRAVKRIVLLSDGQDRYEPATYRDLAEEFDEEGISIMTAGIGSGYDEAVMLALANASGGIPADLSEDDISEFLSETVGDTDQVILSNPELEIELAQGFILNNDEAYFDAPIFKRRTIDTGEAPASVGLPELQVGESHRLTFELLGQPRSVGVSHELADLRVVDENASVVAETSVEVEYTGQPGIERAVVEKNRAAAEVTVDIQKPDVSKAEVEDAIDDIEEQGWTDTATDLKATLNTADEDGIISVSENRLDEKPDR